MVFLIDKTIKKRSGIYKIVNTITGKIYIGSSVCLYNRFRYHKHELEKQTHNNIKLTRSVLKHGLNKFTFELVELCDVEWLVNKEQYWIDFYQSAINGYNIAINAGSTRGMKLSKESLDKIVATRRKNGWPVSEQTRKRMSIALKGRVFTPETIEKMKLAAKKRMLDPAVKGKMIKTKLGKRQTDEHKKKISDGMKLAHKNNPNLAMQKSIIAKELGLIPPSPKGRIVTEETRKKLSILNKARIRNNKNISHGAT